MATPTNLPAAVATGDVGTAAQFNNLRGAFRILQVVFGSSVTQTSSSSTTYVDSTLTANITPQSASSQILVIVTHSCYTSASSTGIGLRLLRGATVLNTSTDYGFGSGSNSLSTFSLTWLDSPASTSALTYKTQMSRTSGAGIAYTQINSNPGTLVLLEVSA